MSSKKYFIAIVLPEPQQGVVESVKRELFQNYGLKGSLRSPAHITLHRPFSWLEEKENLLVEKLNQFKHENNFQIFLRNFDGFEPRVIFVHVEPNEALSQLHRAFKRFAQKELRLFNEVNDLRGFHPHVTVAFRDLKKPLFYRLTEEFRNKTLELNFEFRNLSLLRLNKTWEVIHSF